MTAAANAYARDWAFYAFPASGPAVPRKGPSGLRILRGLVQAAAALIPSLRSGGGIVHGADRTHGPAAPTRGARKIPEGTEV